ncbi:MAG: T9SS type A sorting domain-containing protein [Lewinellaceae bacterium]|nr:T9SS type A sorting domain-containing protein [Lewinellaceae bacterium]
MEAAILPSCAQPYVALNCGTLDPNFPVIGATSLTVGRVYYLVVDGVNDAICRYEVNVSYGSASPPPLGAMDTTIQGLKLVCPNATTTYSIPSVPNAISYTWTAPPGAKINGGTNLAILPSAPGPNASINVQFGTAGGVICVTASNGCDTPKTTCILVVNQPLTVNQLPDLTLCFEELPFFWGEEPGNLIAAPGTYTLTSVPYESYLGCDSLVRQKITALPRKFRTLPLQRLCKDECFEINGFPYCETGTFQELLISDDGCDSLVLFSILKVPANAGVEKPDTLTCRTPSITLRADTTTTMGNSVFYKWVDNLGNTLSTTQTLTVTDAGPFYFIVNNVSGNLICSDTAIVTVPVNQTLPLANAGPNRVLTCDVPLIQLQGTASVGPQYNYLWLAFNGGNIVSGSTTLTPNVNAPGTYRLRVTNELNGCTQTDNTIVTAAVLPPALTATGGTVSCEVPVTTLQSTTNAAGATFAWTGPGSFASTLQNPTVNTAGEYTVVVTDSITGCTNVATAIVLADTAPPGAIALGGVLTCVEATVELSGTSPGNNPVFAWVGPDGFSSSLSNPIVEQPGSYLLTVTGANGCTSTATAVVVLDNTPPGAQLDVAANLNCNNNTVNITATSMAPGAFRTHLWTLPDGSEVSTGNNPILAAGTPGGYSVVITNTQNGCTSTATATVVQTPAVTAGVSNVINVACFGQQNGSATAIGGGGSGTYFYTWNTGDNTAMATGLNVGTYTVTVTDGEQCTATATATVSQPPALTASAAGTPQSANGVADGTATVTPLGGTPVYTYNWSTGGATQTITDLLPGSYTVTVTDANGCTIVSIATVNAYDCTIEADVEAADALCFDANDGTAMVVTTNGLAPFTYDWSTGESTASIGNLEPGIYTVVVTDAANCPEAISFTISEPTLLRANATATNMSGPATADGTATAGPTGGVGPYTYEWSNGETTQTIINLDAGPYTVTATDANGCTAVQTVEVLAGNCGITTTFIPESVSCNGEANGSATVIINGGTGPFTYAWSSGGSGQTESGLAAGTYQVTITDANNCDVEDEVTITEPDLLTLDLVSVTDTDCPNTPEGAATVSANGGTSPLFISWSDGQTGPTASNLIAGTYTVQVTDGNECKTTLDIVVNAIDAEPPVIEGDTLVGALGVAGNVTLNIQTLGLIVTDNCAVDEVVFQPGSFNCTQLGPHDVVVTATDEAGNVTTTTIVVIVVDDLPPSLVCPSSVVRCFGDNVVQYPAPVATDNCLGNGGMFDLVSGLPSGSPFPLGATTVTYTYTDADGNVGACTFEVTVLTELVIELDTILDDKGGLNIGAVRISPNGSLSPYTYEWFRNGVLLSNTNEDLENIGNGSYSVIVTDEVGCTAVAGPFVVDSLVSTKNIPEWGQGLLIVPNPTSGQLAVIFPAQLPDDVHFAVFDMTGRLVQQQSVEAPKRMDFDLSNVPDGLYTVLIRVRDQVLARKIVVSK